MDGMDNRPAGDRCSRGMDNPMDRGGRAKKTPAHCPAHRDCPHPRPFAHTLHRPNGAIRSLSVFMVTVTINRSRSA